MQRIDTTYINLFTTGQCNHKCWYCIEDCHTNTNLHHMTTQTFLNVIEFIKKQGNENVNFHFYGGEPLLHPDIWEMTNILRDEFDSIQFKLSTNLNHSLEIVEKIPSDFEVMVSLHNDDVEDHIEWMSNVMHVDSFCNLKEVSLMTQKNNFHEMLRLYELWSSDLPLTIYPIDQFRSMFEGEYIKTLTKNVNIHEENNCGSDRCMCSAGWDISTSGDVSKCSAYKDNVLMNVNNNIYHLPVWGICPDASNCPCDEEFEKRNLKR